MDVGSFRVVTYRIWGLIPVSRNVGWTFAQNYQRSIVMKATNAMVPFEALLPSTYGMKAAELAALLETWRLQAVTGQRAA